MPPDQPLPWERWQRLGPTWLGPKPHDAAGVREQFWVEHLNVRRVAKQRRAMDARRTTLCCSLSSLLAGQSAPQLAAWTVVANVLLNMDAVLTKG